MIFNACCCLMNEYDCLMTPFPTLYTHILKNPKGSVPFSAFFSFLVSFSVYFFNISGTLWSVLLRETKQFYNLSIYSCLIKFKKEGKVAKKSTVDCVASQQ